jgi:hypothetical protein
MGDLCTLGLLVGRAAASKRKPRSALDISSAPDPAGLLALAETDPEAALVALEADDKFNWRRTG